MTTFRGKARAGPGDSRAARLTRSVIALASGASLFAGAAFLLGSNSPPPGARNQVVEISLDDIIEPVTAEYIENGIRAANEQGAAAVLLELSTPGGLDTSMRDIIRAIISSRAPVIAYVAPSGSRAASAGFFVLLSADVAAMAPGTNTGAAHPVLMGDANVGKTMETKIENDAAAYIRSLAGKRGRNAPLAEQGVRQSKSFTDTEALNDHLIDLVANSPQELLKSLDGRSVSRFDGGTTVLHLTDPGIVPFSMTSRERFLARIADPNIAFILGALGVLCLYVEFTHPGMILPGVTGAVAIVLALYAFHMLPINYTGVVLIALALVLFGLDVKANSHGVLTAGGIISMVVGAMILVQSPLPGAQIHLSTALSVTLPVAVISAILLRLALITSRRKAVTGEQGLIDTVGVARTDLAPDGKVFIRGEIWEAQAAQSIPAGTRVRVRGMEGLKLIVEPEQKERELTIAN
ncbi:MAG TPA: nodulation protein NfeD [Terriglobia bacterium]|nr:nodulation protein NfeD [Terriglobia bacterium]